MLVREVEAPRPHPAWLIAWAVAGAAAGLGLAGATGCCPNRPPVKIVTERRACIEAPRPPRPVVEFTGPEGGCPEAFEACLSLAAAGALDLYLTQLERWSDLTWIACAERTSP